MPGSLGSLTLDELDLLADQVAAADRILQGSTTANSAAPDRREGRRHQV